MVKYYLFFENNIIYLLESTKDFISYVRSTFKFSLLAKSKPMNHIEQCLSGSGSNGGNASGFTCANVM